jgi:hypothetical protein
MTHTFTQRNRNLEKGNRSKKWGWLAVRLVRGWLGFPVTIGSPGLPISPPNIYIGQPGDD